ncbi:MAG: mannosyltransferase family protein [Chloroflexota bacterium]
MKRAIQVSSRYVLLLWGLCWSFYLLFDKYLTQIIREPQVLCRTQNLNISPIIAHSMFNNWLRWDTICYLLIAEHGYSFNKFLSVWPPFYPLLIRLVSIFRIPSIISGLLISLLSTLIAFSLIFSFVKQQTGEYKARQTLLLYAIFPVSFFFIAGYTESLFLAIVLGAFFFASQEKWLSAGLFGILAVLTRNQGLLLSPVFLLEGLLIARNFPKPWKYFSPSFVFAIAMPIFTFFGFSFFMRYFVTFTWPWEELSKTWAQHWAFPWQGILGNLRAIFIDQHNSLWYFWFPSRVLDFILAILVPIILIIYSKKIKPSHQLFSWLIYLSSITKVGNGDVLISFSRYMLPVFPFFISLSSILKNRAAKMVTMFFCLSLTGIFLGLFFIWGWAG